MVAAAIVFLSQSNDAALKRRILPWYLLGMDAAGIAFVWVAEHSTQGVERTCHEWA